MIRNGLLCAAVLLLAACAGPWRAGRPLVRVDLPADLTEARPPRGAPVVEVAPFDTARAFRTDRVAVRAGANRWRFLRTVRWTAEPGPMVADRVRRALIRAGWAAVSAPAPVEPAAVVSGTVEALYWDRPAMRGVVVLTVSVVLPGRGLVALRTLRAEAPLPEDTVEAFVAAAGRAAHRAVAGVAAVVDQALATPGP